MAVDYHTAQQDFSVMVDKLAPMVLPNFMLWLDLKVAEYKVFGEILQDDKNVNSNKSTVYQNLKNRTSSIRVHKPSEEIQNSAGDFLNQADKNGGDRNCEVIEINDDIDKDPVSHPQPLISGTSDHGPDITSSNSRLDITQSLNQERDCSLPSGLDISQPSNPETLLSPCPNPRSNTSRTTDSVTKFSQPLNSRADVARPTNFRIRFPSQQISRLRLRNKKIPTLKRTVTALRNYLSNQNTDEVTENSTSYLKAIGDECEMLEVDPETSEPILCSINDSQVMANQREATPSMMSDDVIISNSWNGVQLEQIEPDSDPTNQNMVMYTPDGNVDVENYFKKGRMERMELLRVMREARKKFPFRSKSDPNFRRAVDTVIEVLPFLSVKRAEVEDKMGRNSKSLRYVHKMKKQRELQELTGRQEWHVIEPNTKKSLLGPSQLQQNQDNMVGIGSLCHQQNQNMIQTISEECEGNDGSTIGQGLLENSSSFKDNTAVDSGEDYIIIKAERDECDDTAYS